MRATLLLVLMALSFPVALVNPRIGIIVYWWFAVLRPDYMAYIGEVYPLSFVLSVCTWIGAARFLPKITNIFSNPIALLLICFAGVEGLSVLGSVDLALSWPPYYLYVRIMLMSLLIPLLITELDYVKWLYFTCVGGLGLLGMRFGLFGLLAGGVRFMHGYGGFLSDNNDLALAFSMSIPLLWSAGKMQKSRWLALAAYGAMASSILAVVWTYSRGGFLAGLVAVGLVVIRSKYKIVALGLCLVAAVPAILMVQDTYFARMQTINAQEEEQDNSVKGRIEIAGVALKVWRDHPLFGVGFGGRVFSRVSASYGVQYGSRVAHNTYLQVLADSGIVAFLLYLGLLVGTILYCGRAAKRIARRHPEMAEMLVGIQGSLITFSVGSTFLSRVGFDLFYLLVMIAAAWLYIERHLPAEREAIVGRSSVQAGLVPDFAPKLAESEPVAAPRRSRLARGL